MSQPVQPTQPAADQPEQPEPAPAAEPEPDEAPLNRAARRAKAKKTDPTHVGPRAELARQVRGARPHSKRRS